MSIIRPLLMISSQVQHSCPKGILSSCIKTSCLAAPSAPQVRHPNQRDLADVARRRETRSPSSPALRQHGQRSVPARTHQAIRQSTRVGKRGSALLSTT